MRTNVVLTGDEGPLKRSLDSARSSLKNFGDEAAAPFAKMRDALGNVGNLVAGLGAMRFIGLADDAALVQARLKDVTGSIQAAGQAQAQLFAASQRLQVSYGDMAGSFSKMLPAVKEMGGGANEAVRLAEILAISARLSGASAAEASASTQQFAQALQSGVLQGDELKSILENNGALSRALATGLGITVAELKTLGEQGKLTSDKVAQALLGQYDQIQARSSELPITVGGAWQQVTNSFQQFVAAANEGTGVFGGLSAVLSGFARLLDAVRVAFADTSSEADKLGRNNSIKAWGEAVGGVFAYVIDLGRTVWEVLSTLGSNLSALNLAGGLALQGRVSDALAVLRQDGAETEAAFARIKNLLTGGEGSTLRTYALNAGQAAPSTDSSATLKSTGTADGGKKKNGRSDSTSVVASFEIQLDQQKAAMLESGKLLDQIKAFELAYWEEVLAKATLTEKEKQAISKKTASLRLDIARDQAKEQQAMDQLAVDAYKETELLRLEGQRVVTANLLANDQITKAEAIRREIEFEEQRLAIMQEYLRRRQSLLPESDKAGRQKLSNESDAEGMRSANTKGKLGGQLQKEESGLDVAGVFSGMGDAAAAGFGKMLANVNEWRSSMLGIFNSVKAAFIKTVVTEPLQAQLAAWARMLVAKLGFVAQEQAAAVAGSAATVGLKAAETTSVVGADAVQAATGAAKSQAGIPIIGPGLALAAMAVIFAAVSAMGGKMKSARNGYDIPSGTNPVTQLHEEEMVLPRDIANPMRQMLADGGGMGAQAVNVNITAFDSRDVRRFMLDNKGALADAIKSAMRDYKR